MSDHSSRGAAWEATRTEVLERDGWLCQIRFDCCTEEATTVDHVVPKARGGTDDPANLVAACAPCNQRKGDRVNHRRNWRNEKWFPPPVFF